MIFTLDVLTQIYHNCSFWISEDRNKVIVSYQGEQIAGYENGLPMAPTSVVESHNAIYATRWLEFDGTPQTPLQGSQDRC